MATEKQIFKRHLLPFKTPCYSKVTKGDTPGDVFITVKLSERVITGKAYWTTGEAVPEGTVVTTLSITGVEGPMQNGDCRGSAGQLDMNMDEGYLSNITLEPGWTMEQVEKLLAVWRDYHLNDMKPGCDHWAEQGFDNREKLTIHTMGHSRHYYDLYGAMKSRVDKALATEGTVTLTEEERFIRSLPYNLVVADPNEMAEHLKPFYEVKERETKLAGGVYPKDHERGMLTRECKVCGLKYGSSWYIKQIPQSVIDWLTALPAATKDLPGSWGRG